MTNCSECGKKLGFFSIKKDFDDGSVKCYSCFKKLEAARAEENKKIMLDYISKYLLNKDADMRGIISKMHKDKDANSFFDNYFLNSFFDNYSLHRVRNHFQESLQYAESSNKSGLTSYEIDEIIEIKKEAKNALVFLTDLEKIYKLFEKKGIKTNYFEILSVFSEVIDNDIYKKIDEILIPFYKRISNRLGDNISKEKVIQELIKSPAYEECDWSNRDVEFVFVSKLLDKFNLEYEQHEIKRLIEKFREEIELEKFEKDLSSSRKIEIGDFTRLNGYEFEEYLKNLFELLGYTVLKTSLSGDQGADLIISKGGEKIVVQAKKYNGAVSNKAIQEIVAAKNHYKADKAIVATNSKFTKNAIELALSNDVELWDGTKLKEVIKSIETKKNESEEISIKTSVTFDEKKGIQQIKIPCPFCEVKFDYEINFGTLRSGEVFNIKCPNCGLDITTDPISIHCKYCFKRFNTIKEKIEHQETCKKKELNDS